MMIRKAGSGYRRWQSKYQFPQADGRIRTRWRGLIAALSRLRRCSGVVTPPTTGAGRQERRGGFDGDAPTAILIEAGSGSVLFRKERR